MLCLPSPDAVTHTLPHRPHTCSTACSSPNPTAHAEGVLSRAPPCAVGGLTAYIRRTWHCPLGIPRRSPRKTAVAAAERPASVNALIPPTAIHFPLNSGALATKHAHLAPKPCTHLPLTLRSPCLVSASVLSLRSALQLPLPHAFAALSMLALRLASGKVNHRRPVPRPHSFGALRRGLRCTAHSHRSASHFTVPPLPFAHPTAK